MNAYRMRRGEVGYELRIRRLETDGDANDLRKRLNTHFSSNTPSIEDIVKTLKPDSELDARRSFLI